MTKVIIERGDANNSHSLSIIQYKPVYVFIQLCLLQKWKFNSAKQV